jgi:hypothetical protein
MRFTNIALIVSLLSIMFTASACTTLAGKEEIGAVIARRAQVRSSSAIVAADLKEVVRGDELDILDSAVVPDTKELWLHVRTRDAEPVEGWIEARNVISQEMIARSKQIAKEDDGIPAQAQGQLRASTNIRFTPDRSGNDNILMKLESGARAEAEVARHVRGRRRAEGRRAGSERGQAQEREGRAEGDGGHGRTLV